MKCQLALFGGLLVLGSIATIVVVSAPIEVNRADGSSRKNISVLIGGDTPQEEARCRIKVPIRPDDEANTGEDGGPEGSAEGDAEKAQRLENIRQVIRDEVNKAIEEDGVFEAGQEQGCTQLAQRLEDALQKV